MGKKQKLLAQEQTDQMPLTRAQLIMREEILQAATIQEPTLFDDELDDETPEQHDDTRPPRVFGTGKCPDCGEDLFALEIKRGTFSWFHNRFGGRSPQDQHIESFAAIQRTDGMNTLGQALDDVFGGHVMGSRPKMSSVAGVPLSDLALQVINEGPTLQLSLAQWNAVQEIVERAIRVGIEYGGRAAR